MMIFAIIHLVIKGYFHKIDMKFLVSGHSYMPCDRDFWIIEKRKKVTKAFVPSQLGDMVKSARVKNPFKVVQMTEEDFHDIGTVADNFISTTKMNISKASWIQLNSEKPTTVKIRKTFNEMEAWTSIQVLKKGKKSQNISDWQSLTPLSQSNRISNEKKKDLLAMREYLDVEYRDFYTNLCT